MASMSDEKSAGAVLLRIRKLLWPHEEVTDEIAHRTVNKIKDILTITGWGPDAPFDDGQFVRKDT